MSNFKIHIPQPCNKEWNNMTTDGDGRYCNSCDKTVVDFTHMNKEEIQNYFLSKKDERICGHFSAFQVDIKRPWIHTKLISWYAHAETIRTRFLKKSILVSLAGCMFIVGCSNAKKGEVAGKKMPKCENQGVLTGDTTYIPHNAVDGMARPLPDRIDSTKKTTLTGMLE
jgi:hypothetical protein